MSDSLIEATASAYAYPLLIKHILDAPLAYASKQQIVYRDLRRYNYQILRERVARLASGLTQLGVKPGDTVAVMDWDSHRYLECFFAVPMMGAVLQTVNVRLSPEQILYTLNHAGAKTLLVNSDFLPCLRQINGKLETVRSFVQIADGPEISEDVIAFASEYERLLASANSDHEFADFDENTRATTFYTTGTTGLPKGVYFSHRQLVLHTVGLLAALGLQPGQGRVHRDDVYMPMTPMFHVHAWGFPFAATMADSNKSIPGVMFQRSSGAEAHGGRNLLPLRADHPSDASRKCRGQRRRPRGVENCHRRGSVADGPRQNCVGARHRCVRRLRDVGNLSGPDPCAS